MIIFLTGIIGVSIVSLISLFVPSYYSYSWGYADFQGIIGDASYSEASKIYYSLSDIGFVAYLIFGVSFAGLLLYTILMLTKNSRLIPLSLVFILSIFPILNIIIATIQSKVEGQYIQVGNLVIGTGRDAGMSGWGILCLILLVAFYCLIVKGFVIVREKIKKERLQETKSLKIKTNKTKSCNDEDFSL